MSETAGATGVRRRASPAGSLVLLGAVALVIALAVAGVRERSRARGAFPLVEGSVRVEGIRAPVELLRDAHGVPHVSADSEEDAYFGLGFAHAQDRLGQMLWLARSAQGRTAELVGAAGLPADRLARVLDLSGLAAAQLPKLAPESRRLLDAYARGVNARIDRVRAGQVAPPLSVQVWDLPEEEALSSWTAADSVAVLKLYAWGLSGSLDVSLVLSDLIEQVGGFGARRFFPDGAGGDVVPTPGRLPVTARLRDALVPDPLRRAARLEGRSIGSSAWVISGALSESGLPLLVADAHLQPTVPAWFHLDHVRGGGIDVAGATLPGVPVVWTGRNRQVAWASTHAGAITTDLYVEMLNPSDPSRYHDGKGWQPLRERVETIRVRGGEDEVLTVQSTRHGPLLSSLLEPAREPLALAWSGAELSSGSGLDGLLAAARARDASELLAALARHGEPPLAVVYADRNGAAGMQVAGWIPRRQAATGLVPLPGRARWYDWQGRIPAERLPRTRLGESNQDAAPPKKGARRKGGKKSKTGAAKAPELHAPSWVIAADNRLTRAATSEDAQVEWLWRSGERARRIDELIREQVAGGPVELRQLAALQNDVEARRARALVGRVIDLVGEGDWLEDEAREVSNILAEWDGETTPSSVGAATYHVFIGFLTEKLFARHLGEELMRRYLALPQADPEQLAYEVLGDVAVGGEPGGWTDPDVVRTAIGESLRESFFGLSFRLGPNRRKWNWGRLHELVFRPFAAGREAGDGEIGPFGYGGSGSTVAAAEYDSSAPFDVRVASTYRFAVDADALDQVLYALAPGQSEHPRHRHFESGLGPWLGGRSTLLVTSRLLVEELGGRRLVLEPGS